MKPNMSVGLRCRLTQPTKMVKVLIVENNTVLPFLEYLNFVSELFKIS